MVSRWAMVRLAALFGAMSGLSQAATEAEPFTGPWWFLLFTTAVVPTLACIACYEKGLREGDR